jgi:hypothetical protein
VGKDEEILLVLPRTVLKDMKFSFFFIQSEKRNEFIVIYIRILIQENLEKTLAGPPIFLKERRNGWREKPGESLFF